jgi:hypothetical protein
MWRQRYHNTGEMGGGRRKRKKEKKKVKRKTWQKMLKRRPHKERKIEEKEGTENSNKEESKANLTH